MTATQPRTNGHTNGNGSKPRRSIPQNLEAEENVVGSMLLVPEVRARAFDYPLHPEDFYKPAHGLVFSAVEKLHAEGRTIEAGVVAEELRRVEKLEQCGGADHLRRLEAESRSYAAAESCRIVAELAAFRRAIAFAGDVANAGYGQDLGQLVDVMRDGPDRIVRDLDAGLELEPVKNIISIEKRDEVRPSAWKVPGLLVPCDRLIVTGAEGAGKTTWLRQFAVQCAAGIHPMTLGDMEPLRVLHFDLQDSEEQSDLEYLWMLTKGNARERISRGNGRVDVQHRRQGFDLLNRGDAKWFEKLIAPRGSRPYDLVILGPLYKSFRAPEGRSKHDASLAEEVTARFDEVLTRTGAAIMLEAHAPHGVDNNRAHFRPEGAAQWIRWPEFGFGLRAMKVDKDRGETESRGVHVGRFRGDRDRHRSWPSVFLYGKGEQWPFLAPAEQVL